MSDDDRWDRLRDDKRESGWISPDGVWYGCRVEDHDELLYLCLGMEVKDAERLGWVRVRSAPKIENGWNDFTWTCGDGWDAMPTAAQRNRLLAMGHLLNDPSEMPDDELLIEERPTRGANDE